jgi:hypothetical protein
LTTLASGYGQTHHGSGVFFELGAQLQHYCFADLEQRLSRLSRELARAHGEKRQRTLRAQINKCHRLIKQRSRAVADSAANELRLCVDFCSFIIEFPPSHLSSLLPGSSL